MRLLFPGSLTSEQHKAWQICARCSRCCRRDSKNLWCESSPRWRSHDEKSILQSPLQARAQRDTCKGLVDGEKMRGVGLRNAEEIFG